MNNQNQPGQIKNPSTQVPKTPQMNDRDFINDMLATEKYMTSSYAVALHEASHQHLYDDLLTIFNETQHAQRSLFEHMFKSGWYKMEAESEQKIQQSYKQHAGYSNQFPYGGGVQ
ncbi:spore coat protein [Siminovitchia acidinfaciens]|uniref:Spore coat protein n=1 Tax=Siminovitchia acidinfaciens TaxID=2321395 RepID=A0A429Y869_9BACI|nr:spore coat protein [Siminovitchia acidinfaciens]RST77619.1 spore coat protein [Siminovitchia acidinfaciens]